ncbi:MAG TPA: superinfection immunity protein [Hyphomicrobiaceae bacterium]|nr:superinfection immunity protein [Hyphomicrobiaceae bacterium]
MLELQQSAHVAGLVLLVAMLYFTPALIAAGRHHHNAPAILATNLLAGWTILGWIVAFIWACTATPPSVSAQSYRQRPRTS